jgi:hypothetical protein
MWRHDLLYWWCLLHEGVVMIYTNAAGELAVNLTGKELLVSTPTGAFVLGIGIILSVWVLGWCLRQTKWIGHSGGAE